MFDFLFRSCEIYGAGAAGGIGGGTCAAILRAQNIPAVVWSNVDDMCHQPNEYVVIENLVKDAKVFASTILKY